MFEFHGWASIRYHTHDTDSALQDECWRKVERYVNELGSPFINLQRYNLCDSVFVNGQHNHRASGIYVVELFQWIAGNTPGSYGLLYICDDEDTQRGSDFSNEFRVWRLCRGKLTEESDPFLSPMIPTVEDPYDESRGD